MKACPELIITPCKTCNAHVMSYLCYDDRGHAVITCPTCKSTLFDKVYDETSEKFLRNQRSYYVLAAELMPEFRELAGPGDRVDINEGEEESAH
ncbi:MAG: hypothetical protein HZA22_11305 [Nitrospirae bacterium]|nr:hypothetical protein [Nitrospirota bacterium]